MKYKNLFTPIKIGSAEIKNRFAMAPMGHWGFLTRREASTREGSIIIQKEQRVALD